MSVFIYPVVKFGIQKFIVKNFVHYILFVVTICMDNNISIRLFCEDSLNDIKEVFDAKREELEVRVNPLLSEFDLSSDNIEFVD